jgi:XTP/dITP diphosphohydrolase
MIDIVTFVTGNPAKIAHAKEAMRDMEIEIIGKKLDIIESREEETEKVVLEKALQAAKLIQEPLMVEDSGIFIRALNGFPKTFVHFAEETIGIANILKMMEGVDDRHVEFRQSLAYIEPGMAEPKIFSYIDGDFILADKIWEGEGKSPDFNKILIPPGENKPLSAFSPDWQAQRDARANKDIIHYGQLAKWLKTRSEG